MGSQIEKESWERERDDQDRPQPAKAGYEAQNCAKGYAERQWGLRDGEKSVRIDSTGAMTVRKSTGLVTGGSSAHRPVACLRQETSIERTSNEIPKPAAAQAPLPEHDPRAASGGGGVADLARIGVA